MTTISNSSSSSSGSSSSSSSSSSSKSSSQSQSCSTEKPLKERVGPAIGRIASGVFVITLDRNGERDGMLTSWICQAAFDPPMLTVAVKKERPLIKHLEVNSQFVVNVLSKTNMDIFKNFAKPYQEGLDRFADLALDDKGCTQPVFKECVAYLLCQVKQLVESGDHYLVLAEIIDGASLNQNAEPMVHLRKDGFQY